MKKGFYSIACLLFVFNGWVFGQANTDVPVLKNEVSVSTNSLDFNNLSIKYSRKISENRWLKIGLINLGLNVMENVPHRGSFSTTETRMTAGLLVGIEKQKFISSRLEFIYGLNAQLTYHYLNHNTEDPWVPKEERDNEVIKYMPGVGFGLGFFYHLNENILLGAEVNPTLSYYNEHSNSYYNDALYKRHGYDFSLSNHGALLSLKYRF